MSDLPADGRFPDTWRSRQRRRAVRTATGMRIDLRLAEIWDRRDVLKMFVSRGLKVKYASSVLGYAWSLIEPAMYILIYYLVFSKILHTSRPQYALFIGSTMLPWLWFSGTVNQSIGALRSNGRLITSIALPREIYPLSAVGEKLIEFLASVPVIILTAIFYHHPPRHLVYFPLALVMEMVLITGCALALSALNTVLRDVQRGIGIVLRMLFYLTPILYPMRQLHGTIRYVYEFNPLVGIFELFRAVWFPKYFVSWEVVWVSAIGSLVLFCFGFWLFTRLERPVLKEL